MCGARGGRTRGCTQQGAAYLGQGVLQHLRLDALVFSKVEEGLDVCNNVDQLPPPRAVYRARRSRCACNVGAVTVSVRQGKRATKSRLCSGRTHLRQRLLLLRLCFRGNQVRQPLHLVKGGARVGSEKGQPAG